MLLSGRTVCGNKISRFMKIQEAKRLLSSLGLNTPKNKIPLFVDILRIVVLNYIAYCV